MVGSPAIFGAALTCGRACCSIAWTSPRYLTTWSWIVRSVIDAPLSMGPTPCAAPGVRSNPPWPARLSAQRLEDDLDRLRETYPAPGYRACAAANRREGAVTPPGRNARERGLWKPRLGNSGRHAFSPSGPGVSRGPVSPGVRYLPVLRGRHAADPLGLRNPRTELPAAPRRRSHRPGVREQDDAVGPGLGEQRFGLATVTAGVSRIRPRL